MDLFNHKWQTGELKPRQKALGTLVEIILERRHAVNFFLVFRHANSSILHFRQIY